MVEGDPETGTGHRTMSLPAFLRDALAVHLATFSDPSDPDAYVFTSPGSGPGRKEGDGGPIRPNNWRKRVFYPAVTAAGLERITPHNLRDTAATLAFAQGATVTQVSAMLGHARPSITPRPLLRQRRLGRRQDQRGHGRGIPCCCRPRALDSSGTLASWSGGLASSKAGPLGSLDGKPLGVFLEVLGPDPMVRRTPVDRYQVRLVKSSRDRRRFDRGGAGTR